MAKKKKGVGRPSKYDDKYCKQAYKLALLGSTDKQLADFFEVNEDTIHEWKKVHPEFSETLKRGKEIADSNVTLSLYKRATGYKTKVDKIFQYEGIPVIVPTIEKYPPDSTSMIFWLKNRQPEKWRDKQDINHSGEIKSISETTNFSIKGRK